MTTSNFKELFTNEREKAETTPTSSSRYGRWYVNSLLVAGFTDVLTCSWERSPRTPSAASGPTGGGLGC